MLEQRGRSVALDTLRVARSDYGVALTDGAGLHIDLVEHLLAALGGMGVRDGLWVCVDGPELPLLDGGARCYVDALVALGVVGHHHHETGAAETAGLAERSGPPMRIVRSAELHACGATYQFTPGPSVEIRVELCFDHPAIARQRAHWDGSAQQFADEIAPARTFGFSQDAAKFAVSGRAGGMLSGCCDVLQSVVVFDDFGVAAASALPTPNEPARHKLLDLVGDLYTHGGPPLGTVFASRPGHTATHEIIRNAFAQGVLEGRCRQQGKTA